MKRNILTILALIILSYSFSQNQIDIKVFLEGPYLNNQMTPFLNVLGYLPTEQPYFLEPFNYSGTESVGSIPNGDVVDWILFELRETSGDASTATKETTIYRGVAFLMRDGHIKDMNGISLPQFSNTINDNLYIAIFHRNHLSILSYFPLENNGGVYSYDFTLDAEQSYGGLLSVKNVGNNNYGMFSGNGYFDMDIENNDKNEIWVPQFEEIGYFAGDFNMNGQVDIDDRYGKWEFNSGRSSLVEISNLQQWVCGMTFTDNRNSKSYNTVQIGEQCWMTENLNIGEMIMGSVEMSNNELIEKYCYNNDFDNCDTYGGLYQWDEVMQYVADTSSQGICPEGWYVPTDNDWKVLEGNVDSQFEVGDFEWDGLGYRGFDIGLKLKSVSGWSLGGNGTDEIEFTVLPSGYRTEIGTFNFMTYGTYFWTSNENQTNNSWLRGLLFNSDQSQRDHYAKANGFPIRCIKELPEHVWSCGDPIFDDRDDQQYNTVLIGEQCWMAENLNIGSQINGNIAMSNNGVIEKYCYDNDSNNCDDYGGLYQWDEVMEYSISEGVQGICPSGWHFPSDDEWIEMEVYLDPTVDPYYQGWRGLDCGQQLKVGGSSGFDALFGGRMSINQGEFLDIDIKGDFWTSTLDPYNTVNSWFRKVQVGYNNIYRQGTEHQKSHSVRCLKGLQPNPLLDSLILFYPFNGNANDHSGNNIHGIPNATLTTDRNGIPNSAYYFNGYDENIGIPYDSKLKSELPVTISFWIYLDENANNNYSGIFYNEFLEDYYTGIWITIDTYRKINIAFGDGGGVSPSSRRSKKSSEVLNLYQWYHIVGVYRGAEDMSIFIDGVEDIGGYYHGSGGPLAYSNNAVPGVIGENRNGEVRFFNGKLDEIAYWNRALSSSEIEYLFNNGILIQSSSDNK